MRHKFGSLLILLISFCGGSEISNNEALISSTTTTVTDLTTTTVTDSTTTSSTSTTTALSLSQTESYAQNNTLDQLVSNELWNLFDADPPKSIYPEDLRRIEVLQTKLSDIYPEVQITSIYDEQTYQYHEKYCKEYNITECSLPYISDEHSYVTTTTTVANSQPDNPWDTKNCGDFADYAEAKAWFDTYYEYYGDVANLDGDNDGEPCESLPGGP